MNDRLSESKMGSECKIMNIRVKSSSIVRPTSQPAPTNKRLWTSNLDLVVGRIHILTVYFYSPPSNASSNFFDADVMEKSLADVLVSFYPVAGRLRADEDGRVEIVCNGEGVLFVEAEADCTVEDLGEFTPSLELKRLIPEIDYSRGISSYPLFVTQVTRFKCGGAALGCGLHHTISDGLSALHFINTWSDTARGLSVAIPPFIDRTLVCARDPPAPTFDHIEYHPPPTITKKSKSFSTTTTLKLTLDQLNRLKAEANKTKTKTDRFYSTYEVLAAHLWRCACKARALANEQVTKLYVATDGRSRLSPPMPPGYLGNVVFTATPVSTSGDLLSEPLANTAKRIHTTLAKMDNDYLRSALDYLELQPDLSALIRGPSYFASPNLNINSWTRLPVYDADFGWGRPSVMGPACILYEGTIYILPSPNNDRSVTLAVCLDAEELPLFQKFMYDI